MQSVSFCTNNFAFYKPQGGSFLLFWPYPFGRLFWGCSTLQLAATSKLFAAKLVAMVTMPLFGRNCGHFGRNCGHFGRNCGQLASVFRLLSVYLRGLMVYEVGGYWYSFHLWRIIGPYRTSAWFRLQYAESLQGPCMAVYRV